MTTTADELRAIIERNSGIVPSEGELPAVDAVTSQGATGDWSQPMSNFDGESLNLEEVPKTGLESVVDALLNEASTPEGEENLTNMQGAALAFIDAMSVGTADSALAGLSTIDAVMSGDVPFNEFGTRYAETQEALELGFKHASAETGSAANIGGFVAGSLLPGAMIAKTLNSTINLARTGNALRASPNSGFLWRNIFTPGATAGSEAALYRMNSGGTMEEIKRDATFAVLGGIVFSNLLAGAGHTTRRILRDKVGEHSDFIDERLGRELMVKIQNANANRGIDPKQLAMEYIERAQREGDDAIIMDLYPELLPYAKAILRDSTDVNGTGKLFKLLAVRNDLETTFRDEIMNSMRSPVVRSPKSYEDFINARLKVHKQEYNNLFAANSGTTYNADDLAAALKTMLGGEGKFQREALAEALKQIREHATGAVKRGPNRTLGVLTMKDLHNIQVSLGREGRALGRGVEPKPHNLFDAQSVFKDVLEQHDEYAALSRLYGSTKQAKEAYDLGYRMVTQTKFDPYDIVTELDTIGNAENAKALVEGAKYAMYRQARDRNTVTGLQRLVADNPPFRDKMYAIMGKEAADEFFEEMNDLTSKMITQEALVEGVSEMTGQGRPSPNALQNIADVGIGSHVFMPGGATGVAPIFALRRLLNADNLGQVGGQKLEGLASDYLTRPVTELPDMLEEILAKQNRVMNAPQFNNTVLGSALAQNPAISEAEESYDQWQSPR